MPLIRHCVDLRNKEEIMKELQVRNLRISFKTNNGHVKAVRDISFDLEKGETLAIVGESGSGKSVTAKAMLGILAANSVVEGGEIIYNGDDLLKYTEKDFNKIRGNKFTMIFQDPLSSLDPIMKIGKQMTEATLLNGKTNQKNAKIEYNKYMNLLKKLMKEAGCDESAIANLAAFDKRIREGSVVESKYRESNEYLDSTLLTLRKLEVSVFGEDKTLFEKDYKEYTDKLIKANNLWKAGDSTLVTDSAAALDAAVKSGDVERIKKAIEELKVNTRTEIDAETPMFYTGDYDYAALKENIAKAISYSKEKQVPLKEQVVKDLKEARPIFEEEKLDIKLAQKTIAKLAKQVDEAIDRVKLQKNSDAYTFRSSMEQGIKRYAEGVKKNPKELKRVEVETAKRDKKIAKGIDMPKVVPAQLVDLELTRNNMLSALDKLVASYEAELADTHEKDYAALAKEMIVFLENQAVAMVNKVTKQMAYDKAIRIMEDVGIKEPEKRFNQYPFEFSGGMRQRIVIAIAVAANPDILICDEPTTALDVTIQSQILELINEVKRKRNISVIFITHDLGVVANMADKVAVMYAGKIVEYGTVDEIFYDPKHPYTWALLGSMPDLETSEKLEAIPGTPPNMIYPPKGDAFADRNQYAMQIDFEEQPPMFKVTETHSAATWLLHPDAPKVDPPKIVTERIERMKKMEGADK